VSWEADVSSVGSIPQISVPEPAPSPAPKPASSSSSSSFSCSISKDLFISYYNVESPVGLREKSGDPSAEFLVDWKRQVVLKLPIINCLQFLL
jgi:hypothetical protein